MQILFDTAAPVKSAHRPFGVGIFPTLPTYRAPYTTEDAAWWAANAPSPTEPDWDVLAAESYAVDALGMGLIPNEMTEYFDATPVVDRRA
jgi:hypothetical protein